MMADDLRPEISALKEPGDSMYPGMKTPNFDHLAQESFVLKRAYANQALCCPSRTSMLTSRRPETTHVSSIYYYGLNLFLSVPKQVKNLYKWTLT